MAKEIIAVVPLWDDEKESKWMLPGYMNGIAVRYIRPPMTKTVSQKA